MTIEEKLRDYILTKYKSVREFVSNTELAYSTVDGILKRGIANSSISKVFAICEALQISADELANNRIVPYSDSIQCFIATEIPDMIEYLKNHPDDLEEMKIDGITLTDEERQVVIGGLTMSVDFIRTMRINRNEEI